MKTNAQKAWEMRNAIDAMEIAMMGAPELIDWPNKWGEDRARDDMLVPIRMRAEQIYRITDALAELTQIINDPEYNVDRPAPEGT